MQTIVVGGLLYSFFRENHLVHHIYFTPHFSSVGYGSLKRRSFARQRTPYIRSFASEICWASALPLPAPCREKYFVLLSASSPPPNQRLRSALPCCRWIKPAAKTYKNSPHKVDYFCMAPAAGLEPATSSLTARRSTTELCRNNWRHETPEGFLVARAKLFTFCLAALPEEQKKQYNIVLRRYSR